MAALAAGVPEWLPHYDLRALDGSLHALYCGGVVVETMYGMKAQRHSGGAVE